MAIRQRELTTREKTAVDITPCFGRKEDARPRNITLLPNPSQRNIRLNHLAKLIVKTTKNVEDIE